MHRSVDQPYVCHVTLYTLVRIFFSHSFSNMATNAVVSVDGYIKFHPLWHTRESASKSSKLRHLTPPLESPLFACICRRSKNGRSQICFRVSRLDFSQPSTLMLIIANCDNMFIVSTLPALLEDMVSYVMTSLRKRTFICRTDPFCVNSCK